MRYPKATSVSRYYHVMKKDGVWHLYAGNAASALVTDVQQARVIKAARSLARQNGGRIVLHKDTSGPAPDTSSEPGQDAGGAAKRDTGRCKGRGRGAAGNRDGGET